MEGSNWAGARLGQGYDYMQRPPAQAARMMSIQAHALSENQSTRLGRIAAESGIQDLVVQLFTHNQSRLLICPPSCLTGSPQGAF